jgi:hypothetical protein
MYNEGNPAQSAKPLSPGGWAIIKVESIVRGRQDYFIEMVLQ